MPGGIRVMHAQLIEGIAVQHVGQNLNFELDGKTVKSRLSLRKVLA